MLFGTVIRAICAFGLATACVGARGAVFRIYLKETTQEAPKQWTFRIELLRDDLLFGDRMPKEAVEASIQPIKSVSDDKFISDDKEEEDEGDALKFNVKVCSFYDFKEEDGVLLFQNRGCLFRVGVEQSLTIEGGECDDRFELTIDGKFKLDFTKLKGKVFYKIDGPQVPSRNAKKSKSRGKWKGKTQGTGGEESRDAEIMRKGFEVFNTEAALDELYTCFEGSDVEDTRTQGVKKTEQNGKGETGKRKPGGKCFIF